ncbi:MAG: cytochrome c [Elusimicrobia bacterium]|nr:cytochrome c [Elusimicrobiota bacterium]
MKISDYASSEELKRLLQAFITVVGAIALSAVFLFTVVPGLRSANKPAAGPDIPTQGATGWLDPLEYPASQGYQAAPVDPKTVLTPTPELRDQGRALFERQCASCHGAAGKGDGPAAGSLNPLPRNLTSSENWKNGPTLSGIFKTLATGLAGSAMASFDHLPAKDRMALVHLVRSFASFPLPKDDPTSLQSLAKLFAASGGKVPNKIPVSRGLEFLEKEYKEPAPLKLSDSSRKIILDPQRAGRWLSGSTDWRKSPSALASAATANAPGNGFPPSAATLSPSAWAALHAELLRSQTSR